MPRTTSLLSLLPLSLLSCTAPGVIEPATLALQDSTECPQGATLHMDLSTQICRDSAGALHGPYLSDRDGVVLEGGYTHGDKSGAWRSTLDGVLLWEEEYTAPGELAARWEYDSEGALRSSLRYERGARHGRATWFFGDGSPMEQLNFDHGVRQGQEVSWRQDGTLAHAGAWAMGQRDGEWIWSGPTGAVYGELWSRGTLLASDGPVTAELGTLDCPEHTHPALTQLERGSIEVCQTPAGTRHGPMVARYADGSLRRMGGYRAGEPDGEWSEWCASGMPSSQGSYRDGEPMGTWSSWACDGALLSQQVRGEALATR